MYLSFVAESQMVYFFVKMCYLTIKLKQFWAFSFPQWQVFGIVGMLGGKTSCFCEKIKMAVCGDAESHNAFMLKQLQIMLPKCWNYHTYVIKHMLLTIWSFRRHMEVNSFLSSLCGTTFSPGCLEGTSSWFAHRGSTKMAAWEFLGAALCCSTIYRGIIHFVSFLYSFLVHVFFYFLFKCREVKKQC